MWHLLPCLGNASGLPELGVWSQPLDHQQSLYTCFKYYSRILTWKMESSFKVLKKESSGTGGRGRQLRRTNRSYLQGLHEENKKNSSLKFTGNTPEQSLEWSLPPQLLQSPETTLWINHSNHSSYLLLKTFFSLWHRQKEKSKNITKVLAVIIYKIVTGAYEDNLLVLQFSP